MTDPLARTGSPLPATPSDTDGVAGRLTRETDDDSLLRDLAARIRRAGLTPPALLWLASLQPLVFVGTQAALLLIPLLSLLVDETRLKTYLELFADRRNVSRFLDLLEASA